MEQGCRRTNYKRGRFEVDIIIEARAAVGQAMDPSFEAQKELQRNSALYMP